MSAKNEKFSKVPILDGSNYTFWKARIRWDKNDCNASKWNSLGLNDISCFVYEEVFTKIYVCTTSKQAWDTFAIIHEGTTTVKTLKFNV